jgi:hypothetical protein
MLFETLLRHKTSPEEISSDQPASDRRKRIYDRRINADRRSLKKSHHSGMSRRIECIDRRESAKDRRKRA